MSRNNNQEKHKSNQIDFDDDLFGSQDFNLNFRETKYIGKRTGRYYDPSKMVKSEDGFIQFISEPLQTSLTPNVIIQQIKQRIGLPDGKNIKRKKQRKTSKDQNNQFQIDGDCQSEQKQKRIYTHKKQKVQPSSKQKIVRNNKRLPRQTDFSFSFSLLEKTNSKIKNRTGDNLSSEYQTSNQSDSFTRSTSSIKSQQIKGQALQVEEKQVKQKLNNKNFVKVQALTKKDQKKQSKTSKLRKTQHIQKANKLDKQKQTRRQEYKIQIYEEQTFSPDQTLGNMPQFEEKSSHEKYFSNLSIIKNRKQDDILSKIKNKQLRAMLQMIQSQYDSTGQLNRAIINTRQENVSNQPKPQGQQRNKQKVFQKNKQKVTGDNNHNSNKQDENQLKKNAMNKKGLNSNRQDQEQLPLVFLSQSLKKGALQYYQQEGVAFKQKEEAVFRQRQERLNVNSLKQRRFQQVQTSQILDFQRIQRIKNRPNQNRKAIKKLKTNQSFRTKDVLTKKYDQKQSQNVPDQNAEQHQIQIKCAEWNQGDGLINSRALKQIDKNLRRKQRPQRASPPLAVNKQKTRSNSKKPTSQPKDRSTKPQKPKTNLQPFRQYELQKKQVDSNNQPHKYPRRNRYPKLQYWKSQKLVYDSQNRVIELRSNQLYRLIGFIQQTFKGQLLIEGTIIKNNRLVQNISLTKGQLIDFRGIDQRFSQLRITFQKNTITSNDKKYIEVYHDEKLQDLRTPVHVGSNTGNFTVQNIGKQTVYLQFTLYKNQAEFVL